MDHARTRIPWLRRAVLGALVVLGFSGYALRQRGDFAQLFREDGEDDGRIGPPVAAGTTGTSSVPGSTAPGSAAAPPFTAPSNPGGTALKDGTYTGPVTDAYYGLVQVQATVANGRLTDVRFLRYPNDRRTSQFINQQATPMLDQEAIAAQSADVDIVTGATMTSFAFRQSLAGALQQAGG